MQKLLLIVFFILSSTLSAVADNVAPYSGSRIFWDQSTRKTVFRSGGYSRIIQGQWKFSGDKHKSLQVDTERTFHQRYPLVML
ncbi:hypothetical protein [Leyella lascolaii]|uniref:hypothetical protein n=1 Tax=Leyella lascolaii TaxID=1776379 RepID=UPI000A75C68E|nr:hypothetical protein [Leyella lascolaii]